MRKRQFTKTKFQSRALRLAATLTALAMAVGSRAVAAPSEIVLHVFKGGTDGARPKAGLVADDRGNLYGATTLGGSGSGDGTIFRLSPPATPGGAWIETPIHAFNGSDGSVPWAGLTIDGEGNLYGTTAGGGKFGKGVVFKLSPGGQETVLHSFSGKDGEIPAGDLISGGDGTLYGTASGGGTMGKGVVFELSPAAGEKVLHSFSGSDGDTPSAGLIADSKGHLYGTTQAGGKFGFGVVFMLAPTASAGAGWTQTVLHSFAGDPGDGNTPLAGLALDGYGNLYSTTFKGGGSCINPVGGCGVAFELSPPAKPGGAWTETVLHVFSNSKNGAGRYPEGKLIIDRNGNLYGTATESGTFGNGCGTVYELSPPAIPGKAWTETVPYSFAGLPGDGCLPQAGLIADSKGNLYGTTYAGGNEQGWGTVFKLSGTGFAVSP